MNRIKVLFVCLGNICRSPMAEGVFQRLIDDAGLSEQFEIDSAGTGSWHVGESAHRGTLGVLRENGINYSGRARQVRASDLVDQSTYVIAMDRDNLRDLEEEFGRIERLHLLLDFARDSGFSDVPDPYYNGKFEEVFRLVEKGCRGLLAFILRQEKIQLPR